MTKYEAYFKIGKIMDAGTKESAIRDSIQCWKIKREWAKDKTWGELKDILYDLFVPLFSNMACPLCKLYLPTYCTECKIALAVERWGCKETPYDLLRDANDPLTFLMSIDLEIEFLELLEEYYNCPQIEGLE